MMNTWRQTSRARLAAAMLISLLLTACSGGDVASVSGSLTANGVTAHPAHVRVVEGASSAGPTIEVVMTEADASLAEAPVNDLLMMRLGSGAVARFRRSDLQFIGVIVAHPGFHERGVNLNGLFDAKDVSLEGGVLRARLAPDEPLTFMGGSVELDLTFEVSVP